jgi:ribose transport system ATP-binding protein
MQSDNILELEQLTKTYPGVVAMDHCTMSVRRGEIHAIMGENGAGKSTLIKMITGAIRPDSGAIRFDGKEFSHLTPDLSTRVGIGCIYQEFNLVYQLSVAENIFLGNVPTKHGLVDYKTMNKNAAEVLKRVGVPLDPEASVASLTVGRQQIVEIARSLVKDIKLLIMDEPSAPLTTVEVEQMLTIVRALRDQGITIIYISHRMEEILDLADRISVFRDGKYIVTLDAKTTTMPELIKYMVGRELNTDFPERKTPYGEEVLRVEHLTGNGVKDINFTLHKGEILGFAGLLGAGRTETMEMLFGAKKADSGKIFLNGKETKMKDTADALDKGVGLIPEDRKQHGVFLPMTIAWNVSISSIKKKLMRGLVVDKKKEKALSVEYINKLGVKTPSMYQIVNNLSGGNQQKVVVAKVMATDAPIMIFDEPTRGIDVGAKQEMYHLIRQLAEEGKSIIMVSSELAEIIGLSDHVVVLHEGEQMGILDREDLTQERILTLASGIRD